MAASLVLHLVLGVYFLAREQPAIPQPIVMDVTFELPSPPPARQAQRQIVSQPEAPQSKASPPPDTRLLSERDTVVEKEQLKRGDDPEAGPVVAKARAARAPALPAEPARPKKGSESKQTKPRAADESKEARQPHLKELSLDSGTLIAKFGASEKKPTLQEELAGRSPSLSGYKAFSRPSGSGAAFLGLRGTNDFLPNLPDGDITLLNTKAEKFAVFVRRVATQVFSQLRLSGWESLGRGDIDAMRDFSTVVAVMGIDGTLKAVKLEDGSGSQRFDGVLLDAVKKGAKDKNPPRDAAASDGLIHFVFKARSWSRAGSDPRTGAPFERRWLLLASGLE